MSSCLLSIVPSGKVGSNDKNVVFEQTRVGLTLLNLAALSENAPISELVAADFQAELSSLLGHQIYDVMCIYAIQLALMNGTRPVVNLPLAGDVNIETTFGISREMWSATNTTVILLSHARTLYALPGSISENVLYHDACSTIEESEAALQSALCLNTALRIQQGTRVGEISHMLSARISVRLTNGILVDRCNT